jgi:hypothetical protein
MITETLIYTGRFLQLLLYLEDGGINKTSVQLVRVWTLVSAVYSRRHKTFCTQCDTLRKRIFWRKRKNFALGHLFQESRVETRVYWHRICDYPSDG